MFAVLVGAPGAGKGTQAKLLSARTGLAHVSSGDLFRDHTERGTRLGLEAQRFMTRGALVPDELTVRMIMERLKSPDARPGVLLDGFPRTLGQVLALDGALAGRGHRVDRVLYLHVPTEVLLARLSGRWICRRCQEPYHQTFRPPATAGVCDSCSGKLYQREDDREETARQRLQTYLEQTLPVIRHYCEQGLLAQVNGNQDRALVFRDMLLALNSSGQTGRTGPVHPNLYPRRSPSVLDSRDEMARA